MYDALKIPFEKLLKTDEFIKVAEHKINITIASKRIKYMGIN